MRRPATTSTRSMSGRETAASGRRRTTARPSSRSSTPSPSSRSATSPWPRPTRTSSGSARAKPYCARSSNSGDGVCKSIDAGQDLDEHGPRGFAPHRPGRHPPDGPRTSSTSRPWATCSPTNAERGVFKTTDGGKTWKKVLFVDDRIGAVDLALVKSAPDTLYAALYEKVRRPWTYSLGGPGSAIYKTTDGGRTWARLAGGLPTGRIGRIGLDVFQKDPNVLYAVVENVNPRPATPQEIEQDKRRGGEPAPRTVGNEVYRTDDAGKTWRKVNAGYEAALDKAPYSFNQLRVDPADPETVYITGQSLASTNDGGKTWKGLGWPSDGVMPRAFGDWRAMWIDPLDPNRLIFGSDGGVNVSYDRGQDEPPRLQPAADRVVRRRRGHGGPLQHLRRPSGPRLVEGPVERLGRRDHAGRLGDGRRRRRHVQLHRSDRQPLALQQPARWGRCGASTRRRASRPRSRRGARRDRTPLRFNWTPPIALSPHNPAIVYAGAQVVFRSLDRGDHWQEISPDLTTNEDAEAARRGLHLLLHADDAGRIAGRARGHLGRGRRRQGPGDEGRRGDLARPDGQARGGRRAGEFLGQPRLPVAARRGHGLRGQDGLAPGRLPAVLSTRRPTSARPGRRSPATCPTASPSTSSSRTGRTRTCSSSGRSGASTSRSTAAGAGCRSRPTCLGSRSRTWSSIRARTTSSWRPTAAALYVTDITPLQEMTAAVLAEDVHLFDIEPRTSGSTAPSATISSWATATCSRPTSRTRSAINYYLKDKPAGPVKITVADAFGRRAGRTRRARARPGSTRVSWGHAGPAAGGGRARGLRLAAAGAWSSPASTW